MNKIRKVLCLCVVFFIIASGQVFSDVGKSLDELQDVVSSFSEKMAESLPFNTAMGLNWSDSYIGQFLGIPPRFGVGFTTGFTTLNLASMNNLLGYFGINKLPGKVGFGLPLLGYTVEARIGGFILPFDAGIKIGYLPNYTIPFAEISMDEYMLFGMDLRYSLLPKTFPILKVSAGIGFNHLRGGISRSVKMGSSFDFSGPSISDPPTLADYTLNIADPSIGLLWKTNSFDFKLQASASLLIITPYAGLGATFARSTAGYRIKTDVTVENDIDGSVPLDDVKDLLNTFGLRNISPDGFGRMIDNGGWNLRAYGGVSLNLTALKFDITALYNFTTLSTGFTFGARFQL